MPVTPLSQTVTFRCDHDVLVATIVTDSLLSEVSIVDLQRKTLERLGEAERGFVVDCSRLSQHISSRFLGVLFRLRIECMQQGKPFCLCGVRPRLQEALRICHFEDKIQTYASQKDAVAALGSFTEWEKVSMASVAQHDATVRARRKSENWLTEMATDRRAVVTALGLGISGAAFDKASWSSALSWGST
jgi:anti-anti-sigma regulatory factor